MFIFRKASIIMFFILMLFSVKILANDNPFIAVKPSDEYMARWSVGQFTFFVTHSCSLNDDFFPEINCYFSRAYAYQNYEDEKESTNITSSYSQKLFGSKISVGPGEFDSISSPITLYQKLSESEKAILKIKYQKKSKAIPGIFDTNHSKEGAGIKYSEMATVTIELIDFNNEVSAYYLKKRSWLNEDRKDIITERLLYLAVSILSILFLAHKSKQYYPKMAASVKNTANNTKKQIEEKTDNYRELKRDKKIRSIAEDEAVREIVRGEIKAQEELRKRLSKIVHRAVEKGDTKTASRALSALERLDKSETKTDSAHKNKDE